MTRQTQTSENNVETLRSELKTLREDVGELVQTVVGMARDGATDTKQAAAHELEHRLAQLEHAYGVARKQGKQAVETAQQTVEAHPLVTLATAFGIGALIGHLMRKD
ncbi:DUF883 family protein [Planctomycetales bacterium ZRK34]|nr:DUF883 family protein [Planctomycetales bacterium ZRK34]